MTIKNFIQLVEQADIPNMQIIGQLGDGFANIRYNGMAGVLDQQSNKMILISQKIPDAYQIVTVTGGREMTDYVGADQIGPATKKALDSISPRQRPRPPAPLPSQESYESTEQVRSIVQRMMEDARVPQKPRQGPLRPQTGAGKHKDKKKDQKQGKEKHKGKNLDENSIPFAGLGKHKIGQAGQLRSPGPTGYPKGKLVGGAAESRFGRNRDDQFSQSGRMPRTDRIDRDGPNDQDFSNKMRQQTINRLLDKYPDLTSASFKGKSLPKLIQMLREAVKKPNATTRHLRDYPVSDKDVAKPVKPEKKKDEKKAVAEGLGKNVVKSVKVGNFRHDLVDTGMGWQVRIYNGDELYDTGLSKNSEQKGLAALDDAVAYTKKQLNIKEQGVAEAAKWRDPKYKDRLYTQEPGDSDDYDSIGYGYDFPERPENDPGQKRRMGGVGSEFDNDDLLKKGQGIGRSGIKHSLNLAGNRKGLPSRDQINSLKASIKNAHGKHRKPNLPEQGVAEGLPQTLRKVVPGYAKREIDKKMDAGKFGKTDADKDANFHRYKKIQDKIKEQGVAEEKQKGVDGKACWKGYKRMGTKKKGGKTVDNCVKMESISEGILQSFGLKEVSPPGFKGTVKAMKKHPELTKGKTKDGKEKNPWALAWHMKNKGYKSHKKADGSDKD
jgi:hypothetical protein